jgi:Arc/MetJ family transcription regulator
MMSSGGNNACWEGGVFMRTNIVLDDALVREAQKLSKIKTKRELVDQALREFVINRKRLDLTDLKGVGELSADYDYKSTRRVR